MTWQLVLILISTLASLAATIIGSLVMYTFKSLIARLNKVDQRIDSLVNKTDTRIEKVETQISEMAKSQSTCKIDCSREFVSAESYVRSEAYNRKKIDEIANSLALMLGEMKHIKQMPEASAQIAGNVARQIIQEMKNEK